jgi:3-dehydroquinate synthase
VGDLGGMAAATFLRGMNYAQVPTTLLSQVDSSIGGKVAVDIPEGKNLVGAFHQPRFVLIDPDTLDTLPDIQFASGMAEVIKHAAIADEGLFRKLEQHAGREALRRRIPEVIRENLVIKRAVVQRDERDSGPRMMLNFGHTIGHALEQQAGFTGITHGEAVSRGMCHITRVSEALGLTEPGTAERLAALCIKFGLPVELPDGSRESLLEVILRDKKVRGDTMTLVLLKQIGTHFLHTIRTEEMGRFL